MVHTFKTIVTFGYIMKTTIILILHLAIISIMPVVCLADDLTDRVSLVLKKLGCETPYVVTEKYGSGVFYAETRLKYPNKIQAYGFLEAEIGNIVSVRESNPGEYWIKVVPQHDMLNKTEETFLKLEMKTANNRNTDILSTGIIIKGVITNFADIKKYYSSYTYIQLVDISPGAKPIQIEKDGFLNLVSNLPKATISPGGSFEIKTNFIKSGTYWLYLQNLKPASETKPSLESILSKGNQYYQIFISENVKSLIFDCGNLAIRLH